VRWSPFKAKGDGGLSKKSFWSFSKRTLHPIPQSGKEVKAREGLVLLKAHINKNPEIALGICASGWATSTFRIYKRQKKDTK
jgi:hypothetical protein